MSDLDTLMSMMSQAAVGKLAPLPATSTSSPLPTGAGAPSTTTQPSTTTPPVAGDPGSIITYDLGDGKGPRTGIVAHKGVSGYGLADGSGVGFKLVQSVEPPANGQQPAPDGNSLDNLMSMMAQAAAGKLPPSPTASPPPGTMTGLLANAGAGAAESAADLLGAPADLARALWNSGGLAAAATAAPGTMTPPAMIGVKPPQLPPLPGGSQSIENAMGAVGFNPRNVVASNDMDQLARAAGYGAANMLLPFGVARGAAALGGRGLGLLDTLTSGVGNAAMGAAAGGTGDIAAQNVPPQWAPVANAAGNLLGGGLAGGALALGTGLGRGGLDFARSYTQPTQFPWRSNIPLGVGAEGNALAATKQQAALAGQRLLSESSNPAALPALLQTRLQSPELVPGSSPTTYQLTGDPGLGLLERAQATRNPDLFNERRAAQNAARVNAVQGLAPEGSAESVSDLVNARLAALDAEHEAAISGATAKRNAAVAGIGGEGTPGEYGQAMRAELANANDAAQQHENALWEAIDPTNTKTMPVAPIREAANDIPAGLAKSAKPPSGEEAAIYDAAAKFGDTEPYTEIRALRSRLMQSIRDTRKAGDLQSLRRLQQFRQVMDDTIAGSAEAQAEAGPQADTAIRSALQGGAAPSTGGAVYTPSGRSVGVRYEVVDANDLTPSHTDELRPNPAFPAELQPRERTRAASEAQIASMAGNLQPERLGASVSAAEGAPIVGPDGVVESGNGRVLAIRRAYQQGGPSAQAYRAYLERQGFDTTGMQAPVLIRRRTTGLSPQERVAFAQEANASPTLALSATEQAMQDAKRLPDSALGLYEGGDIASKANADFRRAFMQAVPQKGEEGAFTTADGSLSVQGAQRMRNALLAKAYGDPNVIAALAETGDENVKAFGGTLTELAPRVAELKASIAAGRVPADLDIAPALVEAAGIVRSARASEMPLRDVMAQGDAFLPISKNAAIILKGAYAPSYMGRFSNKRLARMIGAYLDIAGAQTTDARLFGENLTREQILEALGEKYGSAADKTSGPEPSLLAPGLVAGGRAGTGVEGRWRPGGFENSPPSEEGVAGGGRAPAGTLQAPSGLVPFTAADAAAYRAAADATRERKATFAQGPVGEILRRTPAGEAYRLSDYEVPARFFRPGSASAADVDRYFAAVGRSPRAREILDDYLAMTLRRAAMHGGDSTLDLGRYQTWLRSHADALARIPGAAEKLGNLAAAQDTVDKAVAARLAAVKAFQTSAARHFLGDVDPTDAVGHAFHARNPEESFFQLATLVSMHPDAREGLKRAVVDWMMEHLAGQEAAGETGTSYLHAAKMQSFVAKQANALRWVFGDTGLANLRAVAADLQRANRSITSKLPGTPGTASDLTAARKSAHAAGEEHGGNLFAYLIALLAEHHTGSLVTGLAGAIGLKLANVFKARGLHTVDDLVTEAMLNPQLAHDLMRRVTPLERAEILPRLKRRAVRLGATTAVTGPRDEPQGHFFPLSNPYAERWQTLYQGGAP